LSGINLDIDYEMMVWNGFDESFVIDLLEKTYRRLDYSVTNLHRSDRIHEDGIDLLCQKNSDLIAIQVKIRPRKGDIDQFSRFEQNTGDKKAIYVYIRKPTRPFKEFLEGKSSNIELWDCSRLHNFLVENESIEYYCLYFSVHPMIISLQRIHQYILERRLTRYVKHRLSKGEIAKLWAAKDNSVKAWVPLYFTYLRWNKILMAKTEKDKQEFKTILQAIFEDLDRAYGLCGEKLVSSIKDLSEIHPSLIGLLWKLVSQRTNWITYTVYVDHRTQSLKESLFFTLYYWICPVFNESKRASMSGFYSAMNYLLENFQDVAKNIEAAIDWVFAETVGVDL
jgi:phosphopantetheinyl transferase (holo-ACP synthase)